MDIDIKDKNYLSVEEVQEITRKAREEYKKSIKLKDISGLTTEDFLDFEAMSKEAREALKKELDAIKS